MNVTKFGKRTVTDKLLHTNYDRRIDCDEDYGERIVINGWC